jgi:hypothetical protein
VTVQHLLGLNIFAITELTITTLFCLNVKCVKSDVLTRTFLLLQQAELCIKVLICSDASHLTYQGSTSLDP